VEVVIASLAIVSKNMVVIDGFVKDISFEPCFLHKIYINSFLFHGHDEEFISSAIKLGIANYIASVIFWMAAKTMRILGEEFANHKSSVIDGFVEMSLQF
jgi:hypothetical protein